ncbi:MAG: winged helix-turn-helix transcriptional regulator [Verrucomicrobiae bacterium]|nr:winged helix-turn-helix transcriptional regulator [Verrucomicrobiae bacterium]MCP5521611.1 winged helix-turn-helix transcriptional regulator [Verrucomicrobiales bacterium]
MPRTSSSRKLTDTALELIARRFQVLSDPLRLKLIIALEQGEKMVKELMAATDKPQATVSRQLQVLADAGILARRRAGTCVFYRIADPAIMVLCETVCGSLQKQFARQAERSQLFSD